MRTLYYVSALALRTVAGPGSDAALHALADRRGDRSARMLDTLRNANAQAWKAIEVALAGTSWWDRCKLKIASGEQQAFRHQMQAFLSATTFDDLPGFDGPLRKQCLAELKAARKAGLLPGERIDDPAAVASRAKSMAQFEDPRALLDAEFEAVRHTADELRTHGYVALSRVVALQPPDGRPLLVVAVQYFFRKEVQSDPALATEWQFHEMEALSAKQAEGFDNLHLLIAEQGTKLEGMLDSALELLEETHTFARETRDTVQSLRDEMAADRRQMAEERQQMAAMYAAVMKMMERKPPREEEDPTETQIVEMRDLVEQCDTLPAAEKRQHAALFRAVGEMKETVRAYDEKRKLRKGVLPSQLFKTAAPKPPAAKEEDLPMAEPLDDPPADPAVVNTIFGQMPKPKIRRKS